MNIAIIGLGSMGKRRIKLIREMYPEYVVTGIDGREDRRDETEDKFGISCFEKLCKSKTKPDCVFVCTSPLSHSAIIKEALNFGCHVFTELNLVSDGYDENIELSSAKGLVLFLSSTFLYREEIRYIRNKILADSKWNYVYHIGQYLPDWHPWESYNDFFLGDKRTNGCREILAIELPWLIDIFGEVEEIHTISDRITGLSIDYKDNFMIQFTHKNGNKGCLIVDVVSPVAVRNLEVYTENRYFSWNGTPESLREYDLTSGEVKQVDLIEKTEHTDGYRAFIVENAYKNEIRSFFNVVLDGEKCLYSFEQDKQILHLIDTIGA